jgi:Fur family ferric uptake transcriptional regulator
MSAGAARPRRYDTRQRRAVLRALARTRGFVSAQTLHAHLRWSGDPLAVSTVYRALRAYAETGRIATTYDRSGEQLFHLAPEFTATHYLVCRTCGDTNEISAETVQDWASSTAAQHGFTDIHLIVELAGVCSVCVE